ncbi:MAG TPA: SRPBCC domain-containing protein [Vicinamibacterales bacterium]|nr:SRPBCC domain-containing protein [Vicinamibacterales bacterium]
MSVDSILPYLEPLRQSVTVPGSPADVFDLFTARFGDWWPLSPPFAVFGDETRSCGLEPRAGGDLFEVSRTGERCTWGRVTVWEPPGRLAFTWHPGRGEDIAQVVDVRFIADGPATRVDLEHRDWQRLGARAEVVRPGYEQGWIVVLGRFADFTVGTGARTRLERETPRTSEHRP